MELAAQNEVAALDPEFGRMAVRVGEHAWSLPHLSMREKTFLFLAADLCTNGCVGFPLATHVQMAGTQGVTPQECRAAIRHLAPYVGFPVAAVALQVIQGLPRSEPRDDGERWTLDAAARASLEGADPSFARFYEEHFNWRWSDGELSPRERALMGLATDVLQGTLEDSFQLHLRLAKQAGLTTEEIRTAFELIAEFGVSKAWRAYRELNKWS